MTDETRSLRSGHAGLDDELAEYLAEYLAAEEAGLSPDRTAFLALHPAYASDLREFFANRAPRNQPSS